MLRFAEEILLLSLEESGEFFPNPPPRTLKVALAGAVLMDLALENRIDTDLDQLTVVDATPLGDALLDPTLAEIAQAEAIQTPGFWVEQIAKRSNDIREQALERLVASGILAAEEDGPISLSRSVSRSRRYPTLDGKLEDEVRLRLMRALFSGEVPDPRDIALICLVDACDMFEGLLSKAELEETRERINTLRKMDLIGQAVTRAIQQLAPPPPLVAIRSAREIPQAPGLPVVGNTFSLLHNFLAFLIQQYRTLGPIFRIRAFHRRFIVLVGPEANRFLARDTRRFRSAEPWLDFLAAMGDTHMAISMDGPEHVRMRRAHVDYYSRKVIENRVDEAVHVVRSEMAEWPLDTPISGQYAFQRIVAMQLGRLITSTDPREYLDDLLFFLEMMVKTSVSRQLPRWATSLPRFRRTRKRVERLARQIVADHAPEKRHTRPPDLIDEMLELNRTDPHFMPETNFLLTVLEPLLAGLDTAANICAFMSYELLKHPELLARVTAEADTLFERGCPSLKDLRQLDVTHRVALETLRRYPLGPAMPRTVANSFDFAGYHVPAGEQVLISFTATHLMEEYFPEPHRFDIDRYTPERAEHRQAGVYAPFGVGTHQCLGRSLAEVLIALNIATLVRDAELVLDPPDYTLKIKHLPVAHPDRSFKFRVVRRG